MGHTYHQIFLHFVWSTKGRKPILRGPLEKFAHRRIRQISLDYGLQPLAINSAWTHTHVLIGWNTRTAIADVVCEWKSRTFHEWRSKRNGKSSLPVLRWQRGFSAFSIWRADVDRLKRYIFNQKRHHRDRSTIHMYELF